MVNDRFPYERSTWAQSDLGIAQKWFEVLEKTGRENVRARLVQTDAGSGGSISIGIEHSLTIGFAQEWLAWHDMQRESRESKFKSAQIFATRWAAGAASVAAAAAAIGWAITVCRKW